MNRTIVLTGASAGIGAAAARRLAGRNDRLVLVGRNAERLNRIADEVGAERHVADFARLDDVRALAGELSRLDRIDVLAHNAGAILPERTLTADGFETTLQTNHLAPFLLTHLLLPQLLRDGASVITTASAAHLGGKIDLDDLALEKTWRPMRAYANAKLANVLFTRALHRHHVLDGLHAAAFHPGVIASEFGKLNGGPVGWLYKSPLAARLMASPDTGADTLVWLAQGTPPRDWAPGEYYAKRRIARVNSQVRDDRLVEAFYQRSRELVGC